MGLAGEIRAIIEDVPYLSANLANISSYIFEEMKDLNWAGFYLMRDGKLVLNSFQGKIACTEIQIGKGVCGTAVERDETLVVNDVHTFSTHIACDSASNSEIVIPVHLKGEVFGVLDIDSPLFSRFLAKDRESLEEVVKVLEDLLPDMKM